MNKISKRKGITLIEILAVVVILGIISAITINYFGNKVKDGELAAGINQASLVETALTKYLTDDITRDIPLMVEGADYIEKPVELDLSLLQGNLSGEIKGKFYIYGPFKQVSYDYPEDYIEKVYNEYNGNKTELLIQGTQFIDTSKLVTLKLIPNEAITSYFLSNNGEIIQMPKDDQYDSVKETENGKAKVSTPVITPSKSSPYYEGDTLKFTASSFSNEGGIRYDWEGLNDNNLYAIGTHTVSVIATDKKGNKSDKASFTFNVVKKPTTVVNNPPSKPEITVEPMKNSYKSSDVINLTALSTDPDGDEVSYVWINKSATNKYPRGITNVSVYAIDTKGATSPKATVRLITENGSPTIEKVVQTPEVAYQYDSITLTPIANDPDGDVLTFEWQGVTGVNAGKFPIGQHNAKVKAKDSFNGESAWFSFKIIINNYLPTAPTLNVSPKENVYKNTLITISASGSTDRDNHKITYEWVNKQNYYERGSHIIRVRAKDELGGYSEYTSYNLIVLNSKPSIPVITVSPSSNIKGNTNVTFSATSTDIDGDSLIYEWVNKKTNYPIGTHTVKARAYDGFNYSDYGTLSFTVTNTNPVLNTFTTNKTSYNPGETIVYNISASDLDGDAITYEYSSNYKTSYTSPGSYTVQARAKDSNGGYSDWKSVTFTIINRPPTAPVVTVSPTNIKPSVYVTFNASSTDPDGHSVSYEWKLGNGQWSSTPPNGYFPEASYTLYVRAKDSLGAYSPTTEYLFASVVNSYDFLFQLRWMGGADLDFYANIAGQTIYYGNKSYVSGDNSITLNIDNTNGTAWNNPEVITINGFNYQSVVFYVRNYNSGSYSSAVLEVIDRRTGRIMSSIPVNYMGNIATVNLQGPGETELRHIIRHQ